MEFYHPDFERCWLVKFEKDVVYRIPTFQEEYPDGHSHPVTGGAEELSIEEQRQYKELLQGEKRSLADVPNAVLSKAEGIEWR